MTDARVKLVLASGELSDADREAALQALQGVADDTTSKEPDAGGRIRTRRLE